MHDVHHVEIFPLDFQIICNEIGQWQQIYCSISDSFLFEGFFLLLLQLSIYLHITTTSVACTARSSTAQITTTKCTFTHWWADFVVSFTFFLLVLFWCCCCCWGELRKKRWKENMHKCTTRASYNNILCIHHIIKYYIIIYYQCNHPQSFQLQYL